MSRGQKYDREKGVITYADRIDFLSKVNSAFQLKIVTSKNKKEMLFLLGTEGFSERAVFEYGNRGNISQEELLQRLLDCSIIASCSVETFISELMPIYSSLNYKIGYISAGTRRLPPEVIHIEFHRLKSSLLLSIEEPKNKGEAAVSTCHIKIQYVLMMEDVVSDLLCSSFSRCCLYNVFMQLFFNNMAPVGRLMVSNLVCLSSNRFDLYWSLAIIIVNRHTFTMIYNKIMYHRYPYAKKRSLREKLYWNLLLCIYTAFAFYQFGALSCDHLYERIFIYLLSSSIVRLQVMNSYLTNSKRLLTFWKSISFVLILHLAMLGYAELKGWENPLEGFWEGLWYSMGLVLIYLLFSIIG